MVLNYFFNFALFKKEMIIFVYFLSVVQSVCPDPGVQNDTFEECVNRELESFKNRSFQI